MFLIKKEETKTHKIYKFLSLNLKLRKRNTNNVYLVDKTGKKRKVRRIKGLKIKFAGCNSSVIIHSPIIKFKESFIKLGTGCNVEIKSSSKFAEKLKILAEAENTSCYIGEEFLCRNGCLILLHAEPNLSVSIGDNCMFGTNVLLRTSDAHTVIDRNTGEILNYGKSITIGNHVWLAKDVSVLKGGVIADNTIVAANSIVTKPLNEEYAMYAGTPAVKKKDNLQWFVEGILDYKKHKNIN